MALRAGDGGCRGCGEWPPRPPRTDSPSPPARAGPAGRPAPSRLPPAPRATRRCLFDAEALAAAAPELERQRELGQRLQAARLAKLRAPPARPPPSLWAQEQLKLAGQPVEGPRLSAAEADAHHDQQCRAAGKAGEDFLFDWLALTALSLGQLVEVARDRHKNPQKNTVRIPVDPERPKKRRKREKAAEKDATTEPVPLEQWAAWVAAAGGEGYARFLGTAYGGVRALRCDRWPPGQQRSDLCVVGEDGLPVGSVDAVLHAPRGQGQMRPVKDSLVAFEAKLTTKVLRGNHSDSHLVGDLLWGLGCVLLEARKEVERKGDAADEAAPWFKHFCP
jgi:hypothetical protein